MLLRVSNTCLHLGLFQFPRKKKKKIKKCHFVKNPRKMRKGRIGKGDGGSGREGLYSITVMYIQQIPIFLFSFSLLLLGTEKKKKEKILPRKPLRSRDWRCTGGGLFLFPHAIVCQLRRRRRRLCETGNKSWPSKQRGRGHSNSEFCHL